MYGNKGDISAIIEEGCKFEGNLSFNGVARISGVVNGSVFSNDTTSPDEGALPIADIWSRHINRSKLILRCVKLKDIPGRT